MNESAGMKTGPDGTAMLSGDLTFATVRSLSQQGEALVSADKDRIRIDLQDVERIDSSGLALLLEWQSRARSSGGSIEIINAPNDLLRLARLCEAEELLQMQAPKTTDIES